jgi:serine/threonine-protein kinase RsbW
LEPLHRAFRQFADRHELASPVRSAVNLALEEVIVNVIAHGYHGQDDQSIAVEVRVEPDAVVVTIEDSAAAFNPLDVPTPDVTTPLEQRRPGGLGIHLTRKLMDGLHYSRIHGKNRLVLTKGLPARPG